MAKQKLTSRNLFDITVVENIDISPAGNEIVFVRRSIDARNNRNNTQLALVPYGGSPRKIKVLTRGRSASSPRFSPSGKEIAYLGDNGEIFVVPRSGGKSRQITDFGLRFVEFVWHPNGKLIVATARVDEKGLKRKEETDPYIKFNEDVKVIREIPFKSDEIGFFGGKNSQVFVIDVKTGKAKQITFGPQDTVNPNCSPDGKWIAVSTNRNPNSNLETYSHIYLYSMDGKTSLNLTPGQYAFAHPSFSPDGKSIAFIGNAGEKDGYTFLKGWTVSANGENLTCVTESYDLPLMDWSVDDLHPGYQEIPKWSADGSRIYVSVSNEGRTYLIEVEVESKKILKELGKNDHAILNWAVAAGPNKAALVITDPDTPNDIWSLDLGSGSMHRLTDVNADFMKSHSFSPPIRFVTANGNTKIEGWIIKPPGLRNGEKSPALLRIRGGPMYYTGYNFWFEFQYLANQGYSIVYCNPRGSIGYGQAFCKAIQGNWGKLDYEDFMAVIDKVGEIAPWIDRARWAVAGSSYGAFMTNWMIGHTDRFQAAIAMGSLNNWSSFYGHSDMGFQISEWEYQLPPWKNPEPYLLHSPVSYVESIQTPLLLIQAEQDHRVPVPQAEELFTAMRRLNKNAVLITVPGESHIFAINGKPWHRIFRLEAMNDWLSKHLLHPSSVARKTP